jgi:hypothetical protein
MFIISGKESLPKKMYEEGTLVYKSIMRHTPCFLNSIGDGFPLNSVDKYVSLPS